MKAKSLNISQIESLIEDLSDEELASCSGGLLGGLLNNDLHLGSDNVDLTVRVYTDVLGLDLGLETDPSVRARTTTR